MTSGPDQGGGEGTDYSSSTGDSKGCENLNSYVNKYVGTYVVSCQLEQPIVSFNDPYF